MSYRFNEFRLTLPEATALQDSSINILRFESLGTSLIVSRSLLADGETLQSNFDSQLQRLQQQVKDLRFLPAQVVQVGVQAVEAIELSSQFSKGTEKVYQYQLALVLPGTRRMLAISYVKPQPLGQVEAAHWDTLKHSLDFDNLG
jgi:hypothetical protein